MTIDPHNSAGNFSLETNQLIPEPNQLIPEPALSRTNQKDFLRTSDCSKEFKIARNLSNIGGNFSKEPIDPHRNSDYSKLSNTGSNLTLKPIDSFGISDCSTLETNKSLNKQVNTFLTDTFDPLVTIEPICAILNFENVVNLKFELDTGASDNMISKKNFDLLQASLVKQGRNK